MLTIIQVIAILQGVFLGLALFHRRLEYKKPVFWLFIGCIISVVLFAIGDDDYNLLVEDSNWVFFHEPLMITFFFLFIRYNGSQRDAFNKSDIIFFVPYLLYILFEALSNLDSFEDYSIWKICEEIIEFAFVGMLLYSVYDIIKNKKEKWSLLFIIPLAIIFLLDEISSLFLKSHFSFLDLDSYGVFLVAVFLFYFVTYKLITSPKDILPSLDNKYKSSKLSSNEIESIKKELNRLMTEEKLFKDQKLNANELAKQLGITRQYLSEILNVHMGVRFQDYLNQHRIKEFIEYLEQDNYKQFTLFGIATEVGFSSKSSFNATFKKFMGMTPSQYRKQEI